jgi:hypothetical protein
MMPGVAAIAVALTLGYIAHYDFGLSRVEIRTPALVGAGIIAVLVAVEFFGKKLRRAKWLERDIGPRWAPLFSKKIPQSRQLNDVVRRQNRANQISLRHCVNFIQMTLRFGLQHKLPDAFVEGAFDDHVGTRAEGGANALLVEWRPFSKRCGSTKINSAIGHAGIEAQDMAQSNTGRAANCSVRLLAASADALELGIQQLVALFGRRLHVCVVAMPTPSSQMLVADIAPAISTAATRICGSRQRDHKQRAAQGNQRGRSHWMSFPKLFDFMFQGHCGVFWSKRQIDSGVRRKASRRSPARPRGAFV